MLLLFLVITNESFMLWAGGPTKSWNLLVAKLTDFRFWGADEMDVAGAAEGLL